MWWRTTSLWRAVRPSHMPIPSPVCAPPIRS
jgi:hypothetical protein